MKVKFESVANEYDSWFDTPVGSAVKVPELNALLNAL